MTWSNRTWRIERGEHVVELVYTACGTRIVLTPQAADELAREVSQAAMAVRRTTGRPAPVQIGAAS